MSEAGKTFHAWLFDSSFVHYTYSSFGINRQQSIEHSVTASHNSYCFHNARLGIDSSDVNRSSSQAIRTIVIDNGHRLGNSCEFCVRCIVFFYYFHALFMRRIEHYNDSRWLQHSVSQHLNPKFQTRLPDQYVSYFRVPRRSSLIRCSERRKELLKLHTVLWLGVPVKNSAFFFEIKHFITNITCDISHLKIFPRITKSACINNASINHYFCLTNDYFVLSAI